MPRLPESITDLLAELQGDDFAIATACLAYATGDAFGVAYEFQPKVRPPVPKQMLGKDDWPAGGVSDDTLLSLMTIACLTAETPEAAKQLFLQKLKAASKSLRGLGPTTRHALGIFVEDREVGIIGTTNGGIMRTALLSLGFKDQAARQQWVSELCAATHFKTEALQTAQVMAEVFTAALAHKQVFESLENAIEHLPLDTALITALAKATEFEFPEAGISLNPTETLLAVLQIASSSHTVWQAYEASICAGGDTDTIAALSGALVALQNPQSFYELDFIEAVNWQEIPELVTCIRQILENRSQR
ncbi:MAG: ADP-ribosylglycohydrolase family protein [Micrococcales bacterium]